MSSQIGKKITVSIFGESHGPAIGMVMDNPPVGIKIDTDYILQQNARRAPGNDPISTPRKEKDLPEFLSGVKEGVTTGAPLTAIIRNTNTKSSDYASLMQCPRPSHSDYAAYVHYKGFNDITGGGHFSGRLTAPIVTAGSILRLYLKEKNIEIGGHILKLGSAEDRRFDPVNVDADTVTSLSKQNFAVLDPSVKEKMRAQVEIARMDCDSLGGIVEIAVTGLPAGLGGPMFDGVENMIATAVFGIPAVKGIEFGAGFDFAKMRGSEANDQMYYDGDRVRCSSNNCGGITGGITNSMPIVFRVALKPTPSIFKEQKTVNLITGENSTLKIHGRHDPCIVPRALPAIEAVTAIAIANLLSEVAD